MLPGTLHHFNAGATSNVLIPSQAAGNDSNTIVLLHMDAPTAQGGTAYFKDSAYGAPFRKNLWTVASLAPYVTPSYPFNMVGYFSGVIQCPDAPDLNLSGDFTIDFWAAFHDTSSSGSIVTKRPVATYGPFLFYQLNNQVYFYASSNGTSWDLVGGALIANGFIALTWYHFAVTRQGSTWRTFLNGNLVQTIPGVGGALMVNTSPVTVGGSVGGDYMSGWVDEVRISNICRWTNSFTMPNSPYYPNIYQGGNDAATKLLLHFDNNFTDSAKGSIEPSRTLTNNGCTFAGTAGATTLKANVLFVTGDAQRVIVPHAEELNAYRGNFTVECWYYRNANGFPGDIIAKREGTTYSPYLLYEGGNGNVSFLISNAGTAWDINWTVTPSIPLSTWTHLAGVRNGTDLAFYVNGALVGNQNIGLSGLYNATGGMNIGGNNVGSPRCFIEEVRFSDVARWTGPFTPPTAPYS